MEKVPLKRKFLTFGGDFNLVMFMLNIIYMVGGVAMFVCTSLIDYDPASMALVSWLGMCLMMIGSAYFVFVCWGPKSYCGFLWKVLSIIIATGILTGLYFLFRFILFNSYERYHGDIETIHISIISTLIAGGLVTISYVVFSFFGSAMKRYVLLTLIAIVIAFVAMFLANLIRFWSNVIEMVGGIITLIFLAKLFETPGHSSSSHKVYKTSDGHTLTHHFGDEYRDENGDVWISDDNGHTAYKK